MDSLICPQVSRFKRERDNYKQMLDAAQKTMAEMKNEDKATRMKRHSISSTDEVYDITN